VGNPTQLQHDGRAQAELNLHPLQLSCHEKSMSVTPCKVQQDTPHSFRLTANSENKTHHLFALTANPNRHIQSVCRVIA
jgi:hypothetical protein